MITPLVVAVGLVVIMIAGGTGLAWVSGLFNPCGYMGVLPWHVPDCTCDNGRGAFMHEQRCAITERTPR
jgi:hypothetical protein